LTAIDRNGTPAGPASLKPVHISADQWYYFRRTARRDGALAADNHHTWNIIATLLGKANCSQSDNSDVMEDTPLDLSDNFMKGPLSSEHGSFIFTGSSMTQPAGLNTGTVIFGSVGRFISRDTVVFVPPLLHEYAECNAMVADPLGPRLSWDDVAFINCNAVMTKHSKKYESRVR
jgi:hypothetical protein